MGDKPTPAGANGKSAAPKPPASQPPAPQDGKPFSNPAKNTGVPEEQAPEPPIKRHYPEPTD